LRTHRQSGYRTRHVLALEMVSADHDMPARIAQELLQRKIVLNGTGLHYTMFHMYKLLPRNRETVDEAMTHVT
jgi:hypothetical protein